MNDHKDITDYKRVPTIPIPMSALRPLTPGECIAEAKKLEARAEGWYDPRDRRRDLRDARGFRELAEARR